MDFIIVFFRDILDGPLYIALVIINSVLICSCIGYLGENYLNRKKKEQEFKNTYTSASNPTASSVNINPAQQQASQQVPQQPVAQNNQANVNNNQL